MRTRKLPQNLTFVDVETTGPNPQSDRIIEIGLVRVDSGKVTGRMETLLNPQTYLPEFVSKMTGISKKALARAPLFEEVSAQVKEFMTDSVFVAHNAKFDYNFLKHEFMRLDVLFTAEVLCTLKLAQKVFPGFNKHSLDFLVDKFGLDSEIRHRALSDANAIYEFYTKVANSDKISHFKKAVFSQLVKSLPVNVVNIQPGDLPESYGVFVVCAESNDQNTNSTLYVRDSKNIKEAVYKFFNNKKNLEKIYKSYRAESIELIYYTTHGELGAHVLARKLEDDFQPVFPKVQKPRKNERLINLWPFEAGIAIEEIGYYGKEVHLINDWQYMGSVLIDIENNKRVNHTRRGFDPGIYKIIKRYLNRRLSRNNIVVLGRKILNPEDFV